MAAIKRFEDIEAWKLARSLTAKIYKLAKTGEFSRDYGFRDQICRAAVSITSNIAEGVNRYSVKEKAHFIEMAYGSLIEVSSQIEIAEDIGYITTEERINMDELIREEARLLSGLQNSYKLLTD